jgi:hypothetical protein
MKSTFFEDYETGAVRETTGRTITEADIVKRSVIIRESQKWVLLSKLASI